MNQSEGSQSCFRLPSSRDCFHWIHREENRSSLSLRWDLISLSLRNLKNPKNLKNLNKKNLKNPMVSPSLCL